MERRGLLSGLFPGTAKFVDRVGDEAHYGRAERKFEFEIGGRNIRSGDNLALALIPLGYVLAFAADLINLSIRSARKLNPLQRH